jgi:glucuronate isomerase
MEFKPDMSYYVVKELSVKRLYQEDYDKSKATRIFREEYIQSQSLAAIHFNPENILKRMNFRAVGTEEETTDANAPAESEAAS